MRAAWAAEMLIDITPPETINKKTNEKSQRGLMVFPAYILLLIGQTDAGDILFWSKYFLKSEQQMAQQP